MKKPKIIVTEGIAGHWHYHLSREECSSRSLCNVPVMKTSMTLRSWGATTELKEKYCEECFKLHQEIKEESS